MELHLKYAEGFFKNHAANCLVEWQHMESTINISPLKLDSIRMVSPLATFIQYRHGLYFTKSCCLEKLVALLCINPVQIITHLTSVDNMLVLANP